jgi:HK97 family phage prohead protease
MLAEVARGREAAALVAAGAIDGLSIGFRTVRATKDDAGRRVLSELDLWEVSLVTFPMLPEARVAQKADDAAAARMLRLAGRIEGLRRAVAVGLK